MEYLTKLNEAQKAAVTHREGPLLILAGAGAGKTRTVVYRILHLIKQGVPAHQILAITFTNKAAAEMRERVIELLGKEASTTSSFFGPNDIEVPFVSTFHSLGVNILRAHGSKLGLSKYFSILDRDDSISIIKTALRELGVDEKKFEPRKIISAISKAKGKCLTASEYAESASQNGPFAKVMAPVWQKYEAALSKQQSLDFDDLLLKTLRLLENHPDVLAYYQARWQYVHVDEYQDTNEIQYRITKLLAGKHRNLCVVGDIDQSIYSWRGADYTNILNFEEDYPDATVALLEENYRSTSTILEAANKVIAKNRKRRDKNLFTSRTSGEKIVIHAAFDESAEARFIAQSADKLIESGIDPEEIAVLYRANFQSRALEEGCLHASVPYQVLGTRFFDRKEIKDLVAYMRLALNPQDGESLKRAINTPARGIGKVTLAKILAGGADDLPASMLSKVNDFRHLIALIKEYMAGHKPSEIVRFIIEKSGLEAELKKGSEEEQERLENLKEFATLATKYDEMDGEEGVLSMIAETALVSDQDSLDEKKKGIKLMTVHASKGLEFKYVFVAGMEQDLFPHSFMSKDEDRDDEEERRLFYVAITRAEEKLFLTYAQLRTIYGSRQVTIPSEFLFDIPEELVETEQNSGTTNYIDF